MKIKVFVIICLFCTNYSFSQNWDYIRTSGDYYYGIGVGKTEAEADQTALADLASQIAVHVSNDFMQIDDMESRNGNLDHQAKVLNCVRTYTQSTLTNAEKWAIGKEPDVTVRRYMKRSELARIFDNRIAKAKDMMQIADECLQKSKVDMALQYYYWAYSLIRSVQFPNEVKDDDGRILVDWIPVKIDGILSDINVKFDNKDGDYVDLLFTYKGKPVSSLEFTYSDGRTDCQGIAKDGRGMIEMVPGFDTDVYHLDIEYEYKGQARGDLEMESVLGVISPKVFAKAEVKVNGSVGRMTDNISKNNNKAEQVEPSPTPKDTQLAKGVDEKEKIIGKIIEAIQKRNYSNVSNCFTVDGLEMYNKLISYGQGRIVGSRTVTYYKGLNGKVVARGLQMSFSFKTGKKKTYIEDVVFTFNPENKIESVAFGLGKVAENDILCKYAPGWKDETREMLMEFLENYKTAYNLKRLDYIRNVFADDATIIIGYVAKVKNTPQSYSERAISMEGQKVINYNRYTKGQYLNNLERCFARNEFINIRFSNNEIQWLEKYDKEEIFAIQIGQEYNSSTYADKGYLFLLVDMTNHDEPQIKIRTWQPNEVSMEKLYNAGDFYNE